MSQPCNRGADVPLPGKLDPGLKEFWVTNPFQIASAGQNLSAFERNRMFLNVRGEAFVDVSHLSGADNDGWLDVYGTAGFISRNRDDPDG